MESKVDCIRGGNVWIGACVNIQQQPKRTGGSRIEERGNKERTGAGITLSTGYGTMLHFSQREGATDGDVDGTWQQKCSKDWTDSDENWGKQ